MSFSRSSVATASCHQRTTHHSFCPQLAVLLEAGVPARQACGLIAIGTDNADMQRVVSNVHETLADSALADALRKHPDHFDDLFCQLVERAEAHDMLQPMMARIAEYKERTEGLRMKMQRCFNYTLAMSTPASASLPSLWSRPRRAACLASLQSWRWDWPGHDPSQDCVPTSKARVHRGPWLAN